LSHGTVEGEEWPIAYAFRVSVQASEEVFTNRESMQYDEVFGGHHFTLVTDHEPLKYIMDLWKAVPVTAAARIQHGCLFLGTLLTRLSSEVPTSMPIIVMVYLVCPNHEH